MIHTRLVEIRPYLRHQKDCLFNTERHNDTFLLRIFVLKNHNTVTQSDHDLRAFCSCFEVLRPQFIPHDDCANSAGANGLEGAIENPAIVRIKLNFQRIME